MIKAIRGTKDILPDESRRWQKIEDESRGILNTFGYNEIRTPLIEETGLFVKTVGEDTDIVKKEMFSFVDRGQRDISLRPEGTAAIVRAYLENNLYKAQTFQKFFYIGPMFRAERPQAGRLRQFHQIGIEAIGSNHPALDAEVINILIKLLEAAGLKNYQLKLNNLGCREDRKLLSKILKEAFSKRPTVRLLCDDCKRRLKANPLRMLDCKNENCKRVVKGHFKTAEYLCKDCKEHFDEVIRFLNLLKIPYLADPYIVRGLDYYTRTVFEVTAQNLGAQNAIGAGGRYDNLISDMGGPKLGACGFALGLDRMMLALTANENSMSEKNGLALFIATIGKTAYDKAFSLLNELRNDKISCDIDYENKSLKSQMRAADKMEARLVLIIGDDEIKRQEAVLRDMKTKEQTNVKFTGIVDMVKAKLE